MNAPQLQNSLQRAVGKVSKAQRVADAVCDTVRDDVSDYEYPSDLYNYNLIGPLVRDANDLSVTLSDAYKQGLVGRVYIPRGREKFVYGPPGPKADGVKIQRGPRKVIRSVEKKVVGYRVTRMFGSPVSALNYLEEHNGTSKTVSGGWEVTAQFPTAIAALDSLVSGMDGVNFEEVTE